MVINAKNGDTPTDAATFVRSRLSLRHLRMLAALAETGSLGGAAERLHVTQPAISKTLAELESGLGQTLFARRGRNAGITETGKRLLALAHRLDAELERGSAEMSALAHGSAGQLLIGATNVALPRLLPAAIAAMKAEQPTLTLSVRTHALPMMLDELRHGRLDLVLARRPEHDRPHDLRAHLLGPARQLVVMSLKHPLARARQLDWPLLARQAWVWPLALMPEDSARAAARAGLAKILPLDVPIGLSDLVAWHLPPSSTFSPSAQTSLKRLLHHLSAAAALKP
jgi:DNA-binding transcriptional LysR family regulator